MTEHTGLPVHGYTPQSDEKVQLVNENKLIEERVLRRIESLRRLAPADVDARWLAVARTHIEEGFMAMNRAVFQPARAALPEDVQQGSLAMQEMAKKEELRRRGITEPPKS